MSTKYVDPYCCAGLFRSDDARGFRNRSNEGSAEKDKQMVVTRWQAPIIPSIEQIKMIFVNEGLEPIEELFPKDSKIKEHRHPFDEIRMVVDGELLVNVSGNQLLLRAGDGGFRV